MAHPERIRNAIFQIIDNQMKQNDPPETRQTFNRLVEGGYSKIDAKKLIAQCVSVEVFNVFKHKQPFNEKRYLKNLKHLPEEPFE